MVRLFLVIFALMTITEQSNYRYGYTPTIRDAIEALADAGAETEPAVDSGDTVVTGHITGEVGKTYSTQWFDFTIESITQVSEYAGYQASAGNILLDVVVTETATFDEPIPMGTADFIVDHDSWEDWFYPLEARNDTMMPEEFELAKGETVTYHMIFDIPAEESGVFIFYREIDTSDTEGDIFTIFIN